ncbi:MAG: hypothetical protein MJ057_07860 [Sphaerochaetaceae bacterium]|nr:hypothetical protein [Sphaerochaetaceae bacterium]
MKKSVGLIAVISIVCLILLSSCPFVSSLERDVQVVIRDGSDVKIYTVNQFNNAIIPEAKAPEGKIFLGWTGVSNWESMAQEEIPLTKSAGLVRYDDVKGYVEGDSRSVEIFPVFADKPKRDLVVGWYNKTSTSGLDQAAMDVFEEKLVAFLKANGYSNPDIAVRGYEGNVADSLATVNKDGDVDLLVGWAASSNLTSTGGWTEGVDFVENVGNITIGTKARYSARITSTDITMLVYAWIQNEFGTPVETPAAAPAAPAAEAPKAEAPAAEAAPAVAQANSLVVGWYAKTGTSGLDEAIVAKVEKAMKAFLAGKGINAEVTFKAYDGVVADVEAAVVADANVDIMLGMKAFAPAGYEMEVLQDLAMGDKTGRRIHLLTKTNVSTAVFEWLGTEAALAKFLPGDDVQTLVIGWYAKTGTSGLDDMIMAQVQKSVLAFLSQSGIDADVTFKPYDGVVADVEAAVVADANVNLMLGMKAFAPAGYEMQVIQDLAMGEKTGRRIHLLQANDAASALFDWFNTAEAQACLVPGAAEPLVIGWYAKTGTSGVDEEIIAKLDGALKAFLAGKGINAEVTFKPYDGVVADVEAAVVADANVDLMVGMKAFAPAGYEMEVIQDLAMGDKTGRRIHRLSKTELSGIVFEWLGTAEAQANLVK